MLMRVHVQLGPEAPGIDDDVDVYVQQRPAPDPRLDEVRRRCERGEFFAEVRRLTEEMRAGRLRLPPAGRRRVAPGLLRRR